MTKLTNNQQPKDIDFKAKFSLSNKVIIITGGMGLIGRAFVESGAQFGANIIIADISASKPHEYAQELSERCGTQCIGVEIDVNQRKSVESLRDLVLEKFNKIDGLVNCHQNKTASFFTPFEKYSDADWDAVIETNLKGTYLTCQVIGTHMANNGGGAIINIPSTYAVVAPNQNLYKGVGPSEGCPAAYSASKGGIMALSQYLSTYWAEKNVRVNQITPHGVLPYGDWDNGSVSFEEVFAKMTPMQRMSYNHEVAPAMIYLMSDASSYVTGHNLVVDGGWTAW